MSFLQDILTYGVKNGASDIHLTVGSPPAVRIDGTVRFLKGEDLTPRDTYGFLDEILNPEQKERFLKTGDADLALGISGLGRFRVNVLRQRGSVGIVMRHVRSKILDFESLNLPPSMESISQMKRGLVLVTGTTGSGKSTTLASIIDFINQRDRVHIVTIEDPIEYLHVNKHSIITQREMWIDTKDWHVALRAVMREDPDVILIGEMRDAETTETALKAAETGHLVLASLHTTDAVKTINRMVGFYPPDQETAVRKRLADALMAVVSLRLMPRKSSMGRIPAVEVLRVTRTIQECIKDPGKSGELVGHMAKGREMYGMQTFDLHLLDLVKLGEVDLEVAKAAASNPSELERAIMLEG
jgi:twitching motility protein PilT